VSRAGLPKAVQELERDQVPPPARAQERRACTARRRHVHSPDDEVCGGARGRRGRGEAVCVRRVREAVQKLQRAEVPPKALAAVRPRRLNILHMYYKRILYLNFCAKSVQERARSES